MSLEVQRKGGGRILPLGGHAQPVGVCRTPGGQIAGHTGVIAEKLGRGAGVPCKTPAFPGIGTLPGGLGAPWLLFPLQVSPLLFQEWHGALPWAF